MRKTKDIKYFWKFWSVRFGLLAATFAAMATAYGASLAISPALVAGIPGWVGVGLTLGAMLCSGASVFARGIAQDDLGES